MSNSYRMAIARVVSMGGVFEVGQPVLPVHESDPPVQVVRIEEVVRDDGMAYLVACVPKPGTKLAEKKGSVLVELPRRNVLRVDSVVAEDDMKRIFEELQEDEQESDGQQTTSSSGGPSPDPASAGAPPPPGREEPTPLFEVQTSEGQDGEA